MLSIFQSGRNSHLSKILCMLLSPASSNTYLINSNQEKMEKIMAVLVTCRHKEDTIRIENSRVLTSLYIDFPHAQGPVSLHSVVRSGRNSNS